MPQDAQKRKAWYQANKERERARSRAWRAANPDRVAENNRRYRARNREKDLESKRAARFSTYGLSRGDYHRIVRAQDGCCAICGRAPTGATRRECTLHIDHCHSTGDMRGLLCGRCNRGLGMFMDDPALLRSAAEYLDNHNESSRPGVIHAARLRP